MDGVTIQDIGTAVLAVASAFVLLSNAVEKGVKAWKTAKAPNDRQNERLDRIEERMDKVEHKLENDDKRISSSNEGNRFMQKAMLALLDHGIDGNNIEQMRHAKEDLQNYLVDR